MVVDGAVLANLSIVVVFELVGDDASSRVLAIEVGVSVVAGVEVESCDCIGLCVALVIGMVVSTVVDDVDVVVLVVVVVGVVDEVDVVFLVVTVVSGMIISMSGVVVVFIVVLSVGSVV